MAQKQSVVFWNLKFLVVSVFYHKFTEDKVLCCNISCNNDHILAEVDASWCRTVTCLTTIKLIFNWSKTLLNLKRKGQRVGLSAGYMMIWKYSKNWGKMSKCGGQGWKALIVQGCGSLAHMAQKHSWKLLSVTVCHCIHNKVKTLGTEQDPERHHHLWSEKRWKRDLKSLLDSDSVYGTVFAKDVLQKETESIYVMIVSASSNCPLNVNAHLASSHKYCTQHMSTELKAEPVRSCDFWCHRCSDVFPSLSSAAP